MTKITKNTFFTAGEDWSEQEVQTAAEEYSKIKDTLERVAQGKRDTVILAGAAIRIFQRHGQKSPLYRDFLISLAQNAPGWSDADFRRKAFDAYRGYEALAGSDDDKQFIWKLKPSLSALTECQRIHPSQQYEFLQSLKSADKFPTQKQIDALAQGKKLPSKSTTPYKAPEQPVAASESVSEPEPYVVSTEPVEASYDHQPEPIDVTPVAAQVIDPQEELVHQVVHVLMSLDMDTLFTREDLLDLLRPYAQQAEMLADLSKSSKPTNRIYC